MPTRIETSTPRAEEIIGLPAALADKADASARLEDMPVDLMTLMPRGVN